ncbi:cell division protein FtsQ/DivIB [Pararhodobacter marinus]|uniref:cell division protein FtsQ/DivIB n=1 Tax=Pararhodobacter marinus TaxID=2184063 RepID=UPI0035125AAF
MSPLTPDDEPQTPTHDTVHRGPWVWPARHEVAAPDLPAARPLRRDRPVAPKWPGDLPERAWPPMPEPDPVLRHGAQPDRDAEPPLGNLPHEVAEWAGCDAGTDSWSAGGHATGKGGGFATGSDTASPLPVHHAMRTVLGTAPRPKSTESRRPEPRSYPGTQATVTTANWTMGAQAAEAAPANAAQTQRSFDPSPSRLAYRLNRLWLTPLVRSFVCIGLPLLLIAATIGGWVSKPENRDWAATQIASATDWFQNQPMFRVSSLEVLSRSPEVAEGVERLMGLSFPVSSWDLDLSDLRTEAEALDAVERAWLQVRSDGVLEVRIVERVPAMVWRHGHELYLVDETGHRVARVASRGTRADLPLIVGPGAPDAIAEAAELWAAAAPIRQRVRGLVRVGERRWDLVLDRGQRVLLPAVGAVAALDRVVAMTENSVQQLLSRDLVSVDMRTPSRPTLRLAEPALEQLTNTALNTGANRR